MYQVSFYTPYGKESPIVTFLNKSQPSLRVKILRQIKYVEEFGLNQAIPNIKKITGTSLWELRILGRDNVRIICFALINNKVMVLHIFRKKTQKTSPEDLSIALKRQKEMLDK